MSWVSRCLPSSAWSPFKAGNGKGKSVNRNGTIPNGKAPNGTAVPPNKPSSRIEELASLIQVHTSNLQLYYSSHGLPTPSFDVSTPLEMNLPDDVAASRTVVLEATDELHALTLGPMQTVNWLREQGSPILLLILRFRHAFSFPVNSTATFSEIAAKTNRPVDETKRILRTAMTYRLFEETEDGRVRHTAVTKAIVERPLLEAWVSMWLEEMGGTLMKMPDALEKWKGSQEPNEAAFNLAHATNLPVYDELSNHPDRAVRFKDAMKYFQTAPGFEVEHVLSKDSFDWSVLAPGSTVVDIGGSHGVCCIELARKYPELHFVVQDRIEVIEAAKKMLPQDVKGKMEFQTHDFFEEQPVKGAEVYFLRWILHNWSDGYCVKILRALKPSLKKGSRVLVQDLLIPGRGELSPFKERKTRLTDLGMMGFSNSKERDRNDWVELLREADRGFVLKDIKTPEKSELSMVEVVWEGEDMSLI